MSVGDEAKGVRSCLCCLVILHHMLSNSVFRPLGDDRVFVPVFHTPTTKCVSNRSLIGARHKSPAVE